MRWKATAILAALVVLVSPAASASIEVGEKDNGLSVCEERYLRLYEHAQERFGSGSVGANLVDDGHKQHEPYNLPEQLTCAKAEVLDLMLHPPAPVISDPAESVSSEAAYSTGASYAASSSSGVSSSTVMCESGGDYSANTGNGYYGGYQFDSQTWDAYGDSSYAEANEAPPAVQDAAAASVPYDAWPNC